MHHEIRTGRRVVVVERRVGKLSQCVYWRCGVGGGRDGGLVGLEGWLEVNIHEDHERVEVWLIVNK